MLVVHVQVRILPGRTAEFLAATLVNARASLGEPGVLRFDVIQDQADPEHVVLVEVYRDADASVAHKATPHYAVWRDAVAEMMAEPRQSTRFSAVFPDGAAGLGKRPGVTAQSFDFATAGRIMAGPGRSQELPGLLAGLGSRVLVVTGADPARHAGLLAGLGLAATVFPVAAEPTVELARAAVAAAREHGADVVVAIGGGSVIDTGKAVAMLLGNGGDPLDYLEVVGSGHAITRPAVPCVAVPTTAGTGAEVTANAVLAVPSHRVKASLRSPLMIPRVALVDPLLTVSCPPPVTAASGLDALTQCLEPFVSVQATPLTDGLAREGLRRAGTGLRAAYADGGDLGARADMAMCSLLGGMALANAKLGAVHGLAGVIGGTADVPHGLACAALLAPVIEANVRALRSAGPAGRH